MNNWKPKFFTIWSGQAISVLTSSVLQMALIWHLAAVTQSAMILSLASIAGFLPTALFSSFAGTMVDRWKRKFVIIGADLFIAAVSLILVAYSLFATVPVWMILLVLFVRSIGTSFHTPAISAITPLIVPTEHLTKCTGITQMLDTMGYIIGAAIAGVLYPLWGISGMIGLDVLGAIIASVAVVIVKIPEINHDNTEVQEKPGVISEMIAGFKVLKSNRGLFSLLWLSAAFTLLFAPINALFPLMCMGYFGGTTTHSAISEICFAIGMLIGGGLLSTWGGFKNRAISIISALLLISTAIGLSGILPPSGFVLFTVLCVFMGFSGPFYNGPMMALMQEKIKPEYLGRVFGLIGSVMSMSMPLGLIASGLFADKIGIHTWFLITGIGCFIIGIITLSLPSVRNIEKD